MQTMLCSLSVSGVQRPIVPKKHSISYRGSKIVMKSSKCPDSNPKSLDDVYSETMKKLSQPPIANLEDVYDETIKKMYQPAIEPIIEQLTAIDAKIAQTDNLLYDIDSKLNDIIDTLEKIDNSNRVLYDDIYVEGVRETNDVY